MERGGDVGNFELQMYFYYTNRDAHIYLTPEGNTSCSATVYVVFQPHPLMLRDNSPAHKALVAKVGFERLRLEDLSHSSYSRDLAQCDLQPWPSVTSNRGPV